MNAEGRMYGYYQSQPNIKTEGGSAPTPGVGTTQLPTSNIVLNPSPNTAFTPMAGATTTTTTTKAQRHSSVGSSVLTTKDAAFRFKQNWLAHNPPEIYSDSSNGSSDSNLDDSLTSLNWLQNLRIMKIQQPTPPSSPTPLSPVNRDTTFTIQNKSRQNSTPTTCEEAKALLRTTSIPVQPIYQTMEQVDYKHNEYVKPPYSYATLIWMAMKDSKRHKITLSAIYKWITDNFKYYQVADPSWQNSIRHNLSLNKCFQKVPRKKDEPGKGGFWRIDPAHADLLENGIYKKRRNTAPIFGSMDFHPKRIKVEPMDDSYDDVFEDINNNLMKSHCRKQSTPRKHSMPEFAADRKRRLQLQGKRDPLLEDSTLPSHILKEDYTWNNIFNSEIEVEGMRIKTEDILNEYYADGRPESPLIPVSPPPSEANDDNALCPERVDLDLSISGKQIPRPEWFEEQLKGLELSGDLSANMPAEEDFESLFGHFDFPPSPACSLHTDEQAHPWAEKGRELMLSESFGVEDLFDYTSMPVTAMPWENGPLPSP